MIVGVRGSDKLHMESLQSRLKSLQIWSVVWVVDSSINFNNLNLKQTHTHTHTNTRTHTQTHAHTLYLSSIHKHTQIHTQTLYSHSLLLTQTLSHIHTLTPSHTYTPSLSQTHTHTLSPSHTYTPPTLSLFSLPFFHTNKHFHSLTIISPKTYSPPRVKLSLKHSQEIVHKLRWTSDLFTSSVVPNLGYAYLQGYVRNLKGYANI